MFEIGSFCGNSILGARKKDTLTGGQKRDPKGGGGTTILFCLLYLLHYLI